MKRLITTVVMLAALAVGPWLLSAIYLHGSGVVTTGKIVAKREAFPYCPAGMAP